jgi:hypothetical protein
MNGKVNFIGFDPAGRIAPDGLIPNRNTAMFELCEKL